MNRFLATALSTLAFVATPAHAVTYILSDGNSTATIDDRNGATVWRVAQGGLSTAASPDNVFISNYLFRVGSDTGERPILTGLGNLTVAAQTANSITFAAANASLSASLTWQLTGFDQASGRSILSKSISFTNLSGGALDLSVFDYSDYDIRFNPAAQRDFATLTAPGTILTQSTTVPVTITSVASVTPDAYQISSFLPLYNALFLDNDGATQLNNTPAVGQQFPATPGDTAFAFQFNRTLAAGQSFSVNQIATLAPAVPEPSTWAMMLLGFGLIGGIMRSKRTRLSTKIGTQMA